MACSSRSASRASAWGQEAGGGEPQPGQRVGHPGLPLGLGLDAAFVHAAGMGLRHGLGEVGGGLHRGAARLRAAEVRVEEEAAGVQ